jgi:hypothetical protein
MSEELGAPDAQPAAIQPAVVTDTPATDPPSKTMLDVPVVQDWRESIPEKFRVVKEGGGVDLNAEALLKSYTHLESRAGKWGLPPDSADSYAAPEGIEDWSAASWAPIKQAALETGMTEKQLHSFIPQLTEAARATAMAIATEAEYASVRGELGIYTAPSRDAADEVLRKAWPDEKEFNKNIALAKNAGKAYGIDVGDPMVGNNPQIVQMLSKIGAELGIDTTIGSAILSSQDLDTLRQSQAYLDANHPQHQTVQAKVMRHYELKSRQMRA